MLSDDRDVSLDSYPWGEIVREYPIFNPKMDKTNNHIPDTDKKMNKKSYDVVLAERANDLETLIKAIAVTRVLNCEAYQNAGMFSYEKFKRARTNLYFWHEKPDTFKQNPKNARTHKNYQKVFNEVLGIPCELLNKILGRYGASRRIDLYDALNLIGGTDRWDVKSDGQTAYTDKETGKRIVKTTWCRKILPKDRLEWCQMLRNGSYLKVDTIPNASKRAVKIINEYFNNIKVEVPDDYEDDEEQEKKEKKEKPVEQNTIDLVEQYIEVKPIEVKPVKVEQVVNVNMTNEEKNKRYKEISEQLKDGMITIDEFCCELKKMGMPDERVELHRERYFIWIKKNTPEARAMRTVNNLHIEYYC